jgi:hypothetical protein
VVFLKRKFSILITVLCLVLAVILPATALAVDQKEEKLTERETTFSIENVELTEEETTFLIKNVGLTEEQMKNFPVEMLKQLVKEDAKMLDIEESIETFYEPALNESEIGIMGGEIPKSEISVGGAAFQVTSDRTDRRKYYFYGYFEWLTSPTWELTDKMSIGVPNVFAFSLPMANFLPTQHQHRYSWDQNKDGIYADYPIQYAPKSTDWDPNAGVAGSFDLIAGEGTHKGYVSQYMYLPKTPTGQTVNVKIEYGHRYMFGSASVGVYPAGLSIEPAMYTDYRAAGLELDI